MRIVILFLLFNTALFAQEKNCDNFRTGKFVYLHPDHSQWRVLRTQNTQTETENILGMTIESSIEWKSDCEYELIYTKISDVRAKDLIGKKINVKIKKTKDDVALCESKGLNITLELEMKKVEKFENSTTLIYNPRSQQ